MIHLPLCHRTLSSAIRSHLGDLDSFFPFVYSLPIALPAALPKAIAYPVFVGRGLAGFIQKPHILATLSEKLDEAIGVD